MQLRQENTADVVVSCLTLCPICKNVPCLCRLVDESSLTLWHVCTNAVFVCVSLLMNPRDNLQSTASVQEHPLLVRVAERPEPDSKTQLSQQCGPLRQLQPLQTMVTCSPPSSRLSKGFASLIFML